MKVKCRRCGKVLSRSQLLQGQVSFSVNTRVTMPIVVEGTGYFCPECKSEVLAQVEGLINFMLP